MLNSRCESIEKNGTFCKVKEIFTSGESKRHISKGFKKNIRKIIIYKEEKSNMRKIIKEALKSNVKGE